jgi:hypothetical protein
MQTQNKGNRVQHLQLRQEQRPHAPNTHCAAAATGQDKSMAKAKQEQVAAKGRDNATVQAQQECKAAEMALKQQLAALQKESKSKDQQLETLKQQCEMHKRNAEKVALEFEEQKAALEAARAALSRAKDDDTESLRGQAAHVCKEGEEAAQDQTDWQLSGEAEAKLKELFEVLDANQDLIKSADERVTGVMQLDQFLFNYGVTADDLAIRVVGQNLSLDGFKSAVEDEWQLSRKEQSLSALHLLRIMAACIPGGSPEQPLMALESMTPEQITHLCCVKIAPALKAALHDYIKAGQSSSTPDALSEIDGGNVKFAQTIATFGHMDEYFQGLEGMLGLPNPNLLKAIQSEHCDRPDSMIRFQPSNYEGPNTTPAECVVHVSFFMCVCVCVCVCVWLVRAHTYTKWFIIQTHMCMCCFLFWQRVACCGG